MPDYAKVSFADLEDRSPPDEPMRWEFARRELGSPELGVSRFIFEPGARMPFGHRHREQDEIYVIVAGSGCLKLDDEYVDVATGDAIRVAPATGRGFHAGPDGLQVICVGGSSPPRDGEPVPGFWD